MPTFIPKYIGPYLLHGYTEHDFASIQVWGDRVMPQQNTLIRVSAQTHREMAREKARRIMETGHRISFDGLIGEAMQALRAEREAQCSTEE